MGGSGSGRQGGKSTIGRTRAYELSTRLLRDIFKLRETGFRIAFRSDWDEVVVTGMIDRSLAWEKRVRVLIGSANLTEPAYRRNQEVMAALDFGEDENPAPELLGRCVA